MVSSGPESFFWWPDSALIKGAATDVERLLRTNIAVYEHDGA